MLNESQLVTFKAAILAETDPAIVSARTIRHDAAIVPFYNAVAPGPVKCWRNDITKEELVEATVEQAASYDNLSAGKRDVWVQVQQLSTIDFTRNKIRAAVGKVWANTQRDAILADPGTRNATRAEVVFGGSDVAEGGVTAKKLNFYGEIDVFDVARALNLP